MISPRNWGIYSGYAKVRNRPLRDWQYGYNEIEACGIDSFRTVARSIQSHYLYILNFFINRSTNASAESFNAKIKAFRATSRGVRDIKFFLFRLSKIYA
nr:MULTISPECIES: transposase [unclassified Pedobacter]